MGRYEQFEAKAKSAHSDCAAVLLESAYAEGKALKENACAAYYTFEQMPSWEKAGWVALGLATVGAALASRGRLNAASFEAEALAGEQLASRTIILVRTGFSRGVQESYKLANGQRQCFWLDAESANGRKAIAEFLRARQQ